MGLLDKFKRKTEASPEGASAPDAVAAARARARRRLIGATVLLAAGIIGFPLLFETQPRPIPVDVPIEIPQKDKAPPLVLSPAPAASTGAAAAPPPALPDPTDRPDAPPSAVTPSPASEAASRTRPAAAELITERAGEQGHEVAPKASAAGKGTAVAVGLAATGAAAVAAAQMAQPASKPAGKAVSSPASKPQAAASAAAPASKPVDKSQDKAHDKAHDKAKAAADSQRAQALLDGKPASAPGATRIVVQAGAYTDAAKLREARAKVEKLGFKTYTQVVDGDGGKRTRVRIGPFATKAEADKAAAKLRAAGLQANLLTL